MNPGSVVNGAMINGSKQILTGGVELNGLALCAGGGGLEIGIGLLLGNGDGSLDDHRTVCYVEGEAYAASVLVSKMETGQLHPAPIWSDLRTFNGRVWHQKVDLISAGFPCQPFSVAGSNLGTEDPRHLWPHVARIISEVRPSVIILENVPGVLVHAGAIVAGDLAEMGYDSSWGLVRAADAGAHHRRERWFCTAIRSDSYITRGRSGEGSEQPTGHLPGPPVADICSSLSNANGPPCEEGEPRRGSTGIPEEGGGIPIKDGRDDRDEPGRCGQALPHTDGKSKPNKSQHDPKDPGLPRNVADSRCITSQSQASRGFSTESFLACARRYREAGTKSWPSESGLGRVVDGVAHWMDRLRLLGNGVVPQQAALAIALTCEAFEMEMRS